MDYQLAALAAAIDKKSNGGRYYWSPRDIAPLAAKLRELLRLQPPTDGICLFHGSMTPYLALTLANTAFECGFQPAVYDPKYENHSVLIPKLEAGDPRQLSFTVVETAEYSLVEFTIPGGFIKAPQLPLVVPPVLNPNKGVVIAGRGVVWITAALGQAYRHHKWVAVRDAAKGAFICGVGEGSHASLGGLVDTGSPKLGEVWYFKGPGGPHPCIVVSRDSRNAKSSDLIIVPVSSNVALHQGNRAVLIVEAGRYGLPLRSAVLCQKVTTIRKDALDGSPIGVVNDPVVMAGIVKRIRYALDDFVIAASETGRVNVIVGSGSDARGTEAAEGAEAEIPDADHSDDTLPEEVVRSEPLLPGPVLVDVNSVSTGFSEAPVDGDKRDSWALPEVVQWPTTEVPAHRGGGAGSSVFVP